MNLNKKVKWALLISYNGNSACRVIESYQHKLLNNSELSLLIYEQEKSDAVVMAIKLNIPVQRIAREDFASEEEHQLAILKVLTFFQIQFVFLLGFDKVISGELLEVFNNRIVNCHASLLPSFKGRDPIKRAIDYGVKVTGITTHFIDDKIDRGIILFQEPIFISNNDNFDSIFPIFLETGEKILTKTINFLSINEVNE